MSFLKNNLFLSATALVITLLVVNATVQTTVEGWFYRFIELFIIFGISFGILKLVSLVPVPASK